MWLHDNDDTQRTSRKQKQKKICYTRRVFTPKGGGEGMASARRQQHDNSH